MNYYEKHPEKAICLDVETTGVDPNTAEIVQLSIIDYNGNILFNEYIKPDKAKIWPGAEAVHHISPLKVLNKPHLSFYHDRLKKIFDEAELIIAYNGDHYDIPIIARYGFPELRDKKSYDVMLEFAPIYGAWDDYHSSYTWQKLNVCADYYGYRGDDNFHDSLEDVRATLFCYKKMTEDQEDETGDEDYDDKDDYGTEDEHDIPNSPDNEPSMHTDWAKEVLEAYKKYRSNLEKNVKEYLDFCEYEPVKNDTLATICRYWWIGLCSIGSSGILHPFKRKKINENEINDIAMAANLDPKIATLVILHEDLLVADFEETGKANGVVTYIEPIAALYSMIVKGTDVFDYLPPSENLFKRIGEIGVEAINIGDATWRKVVSTSWNNMLKERFYN